jgi:ABC-2 type transport system permease protein
MTLATDDTQIADEARPELVETGVQQTSLISRIKRIWEYRQLLMNMARRELKVKYKGSALGFFWSLLNPLLYLAVFSVVFGVLLQSNIPKFPIFLLSGLLPFNLFSVGLTAATTSITGNGPLVQKVWFPREILPIAAMLANLITFFLQMIILAVAMAVYGVSPKWSMLWMLIPATIIATLLGIGLGILLSALNVYFRDVQHFLELAMLVWFWFTPIVYSYSLLGNKLQEKGWNDRLGMLNPMTPIVEVFRRVLYNPEHLDRPAGLEDGKWEFDIVLRATGWHMINLGMAATTAVVLTYIGFKVFSRLEANLGEEI